jgi:hypothetical protein
VIDLTNGTGRPGRYNPLPPLLVGAEGDPLVLRVGGQRWDVEHRGPKTASGVSQVVAVDGASAAQGEVILDGLSGGLARFTT